MEPLPLPPRRNGKLAFEQNMFFDGKTKIHKNVVKPNGKNNETEKNFFKTMEPLPTPLLVPKSWFLDPLPTPRPRPEKLVFEQKLVSPRKNQQKPTNTLRNQWKNQQNIKKNELVQNYEASATPPPRPEKLFFDQKLLFPMKN